jgi:hypothetical protein
MIWVCIGLYQSQQCVAVVFAAAAVATAVATAATAIL